MGTEHVWAQSTPGQSRRPRQRSTVCFSGRTYPQLAQIVRAPCAVADCCCLPVVAAVAVAVAVKRPGAGHPVASRPGPQGRQVRGPEAARQSHTLRACPVRSSRVRDRPVRRCLCSAAADRLNPSGAAGRLSAKAYPSGCGVEFIGRDRGGRSDRCLSNLVIRTHALEARTSGHR